MNRTHLHNRTHLQDLRLSFDGTKFHDVAAYTIDCELTYERDTLDDGPRHAVQGPRSFIRCAATFIDPPVVVDDGLRLSLNFGRLVWISYRVPGCQQIEETGILVKYKNMFEASGRHLNVEIMATAGAKYRTEWFKEAIERAVQRGNVKEKK